MNIPGFTAEKSLTRGAMYRTPNAAAMVALSGIVAAMDDVKNPNEVVDCRDYPDGLYCKECGNTGRDSMTCCHSKKCVVVVDPKGGGGGGGGRT